MSPEVVGGQKADGGFYTTPPHKDIEGWSTVLHDAFGTTSLAFAGRCIDQMDQVLRAYGGEHSPSITNAALAVLDGVKPENEVEALLAVQMVAAHDLAMALANRAKHDELFERATAYAGLSAKMIRTFAIQTEALAKLRRKGEQTMRVEHVHIHPGAQAIVGQISHAPGGGGGLLGNCVQPHAPIRQEAPALTASPSMWSPDAGGEPVPDAGGEREGPVPDAWPSPRKRSA